MAYMDGPGSEENVVPIALARLEKLIQVRLAESLELGREPAVTVKVFESAHDGGAPSIPDDPQFYDAVVEKIVSTLDAYLDHVDEGAPLSASALNEEIENAFSEPELEVEPRSCDHFVGHLRCHQCGVVTTDIAAGCETFLRQQPDGTIFGVGSPFDFDPAQVARDFYAHAMPAATGEPLHLVEGWECPSCSAVNWAEIVVRQGIVASVWSVALTREILERAHYVTSECVELAARITGRPAWTLLGDDVFEILFDRL